MAHFKAIILFALLGVYLVAAVATSVMLSPEQIEDLKKKAVSLSKSTEGKDMKGYIADIWSTRIIPEFNDNALEINKVIEGLKTDQKKFAEKYGRRSNDFSPRNYIVKGRAIVKQVNTKSAAGKIVLDLPDLKGQKDVIIQIGPVIKKSAVRDSLSFISFNNFVNQIEFGEVSKEIKNYIMENVVNTVRENDLTGKEIDFVGAFTYDKRGRILITPVEIGFEGK